MNIPKSRKIILIGIILFLSFSVVRTIKKIESKHIYSELNCLIALNSYHSGLLKLDVNFNYNILKSFCDSFSRIHKINLISNEKRGLNLLKRDSIDILVIPYKDKMPFNDFLTSKPLYDSTIWVTNIKNKNLIQNINRWISHIENTSKYRDNIDRFKSSYDPYSRYLSNKKYSTLSPYDNIIKANAKLLNWDWKLFVAVIWQESKFRIEVKSSAGATGIMQIMPITIKHFTNENIIDPNISIIVGRKMFQRFKNLFGKYFTGNELIKVCLGAYNCGEGRILNCINYAKENNLPCKTWDDICNIILIIKDLPNGADSSGTIKYVNQVLNLYYIFSFIANEPFLKGLLLKQIDTAGLIKQLSLYKKLSQPIIFLGDSTLLARKKENN